MVAFRDQVYNRFDRRVDALFGILDALLALSTATAPAHTMLLPSFQRKWGSIYDALSTGRMDISRVENMVAQVSMRHDSWSAPLSVHRVDPTDNPHQVAAKQICALLQRRPHPDKVSIFVFDAVQLVQLLGDLPIGLLVRLRSNRCFNAEPIEREPGGRPRCHGNKLAFRDPASWWDPTYEFITHDP